MNTKLDKTDNIECFYSDFVKNGFTTQYFTKGNTESLLIQAYDLHEAQSKDSRPAFMEISHRIFTKGMNNNINTLTICLDRKNHSINIPFHLNVDWKSKEQITNKLLSGLIKDYPKGLNHMPISMIDGIGKGKYKRIDNDKIIEQILQFLNHKKIFSSFTLKCITTKIH
jgi:antitoxin component YwqK of YwqJK toxin-antitoxin module